MKVRDKEIARAANVAPQPSCAEPDPLALIEEDHALQLELCDLLECLADSLPDRFNRGLAHSAAAILRQGIDAHLQLEEAKLFPLLRRRAAEGSCIQAVIARLEAEHVADRDLTHELADELQLLADAGIARNPEMLGYMLRGFFESQRRHIEWENTVLLPLARQTLELEDWPNSGLDHVQCKARLRQVFRGRSEAPRQRIGRVPRVLLPFRACQLASCDSFTRSRLAEA